MLHFLKNTYFTMFTHHRYDPAAFDPTPPFLDINSMPNGFGTDFTNFGGGIFLSNINNSVFSKIIAQNGENGIDCFYCNNNIFSLNSLNNNVGWGIRLIKSSNNVITNNTANNNTRHGPDRYYTGDTSGILLNCQCSNNYVVYNSFLYGGDGIFMSGFPRNGENECCPSNYNFIAFNDCRYSPNNAIESTFAIGNIFGYNKLDYSNYGLWLGYSHNSNMVIGNQMYQCQTAGII